MNLPYASFDSSVIKQLGAGGRGFVDGVQRYESRGPILHASTSSHPSLNLITWPVVIGGN